MGRPITPSDELRAGMVEAAKESCSSCHTPCWEECVNCYAPLCDSCAIGCAGCGSKAERCAACAARCGYEKRGEKWYCENCPLPENVLTEEEVIL